MSMFMIDFTQKYESLDDVRLRYPSKINDEVSTNEVSEIDGVSINVVSEIHEVSPNDVWEINEVSEIDKATNGVSENNTIEEKTSYRKIWWLVIFKTRSI